MERRGFEKRGEVHGEREKLETRAAQGTSVNSAGGPAAAAGDNDDDDDDDGDDPAAAAVFRVRAHNPTGPQPHLLQKHNCEVSKSK